MTVSRIQIATAIASGFLAIGLAGCSSATEANSDQTNSQPATVTSATPEATAPPDNSSLAPTEENGSELPNNSGYIAKDASINAKLGDFILIPVQTKYVAEIPEDKKTSEPTIISPPTYSTVNPNDDPRMSKIVWPDGVKESRDVTGYLMEAVKTGTEDYTIEYTLPDGTPTKVTFTVTVTD